MMRPLVPTESRTKPKPELPDCGVLATGQFTHPGALDSKEELDFVKAQIEAGAQPWKGEYDRLLAAAEARRRPHGLSNIDSSGDDANTSRDDAIAAYAQAWIRCGITPAMKRYAGVCELSP